MTPSPETTIRALLKRAAKAPADELPKIIDAITALHHFQNPEPSIDWPALEKRLAALEEGISLTNITERAARFR